MPRFKKGSKTVMIRIEVPVEIHSRLMYIATMKRRYLRDVILEALEKYAEEIKIA